MVPSHEDKGPGEPHNQHSLYGTGCSPCGHPTITLKSVDNNRLPGSVPPAPARGNLSCGTRRPSRSKNTAGDLAFPATVLNGVGRDHSTPAPDQA